MKFSEVKTYLIHHGIPDYLYSLDDCLGDEVVGIYKADTSWVVYSATRGERIILSEGCNESEMVCQFLYYLSKNVEAYGFELPVNLC